MERKPWESWVGVDLYTRKGRLRTDDLTVRSRAADLLSTAAASLRDASATYQRLYVPQPSREQPFPGAEHLWPARRADDVARLLTSAADTIRGCPFPPDDHVWGRLRKAGPQYLFDLDRMLIAHAEYLHGLVTGVTAEWLVSFDPTPVTEAIAVVEDALRQRHAWLSGTV